MKILFYDMDLLYQVKQTAFQDVVMNQLFDSFFENKERILLNVIDPSRALTEEEILKRTVIEIHADNIEIVYWDNKPVLKFLPPENNMDGTCFKASQAYQILSAGGEG